jgi:peptidoglycan-associated lipoprotein
MKMNRIIFPLMLALVATMATTGCYKKNPKTTIIPGPRGTSITDPNAQNTLSPGPTFNPNEGPGFGPGSTPTSDLTDFEGMTRDPAALAAHTIHFSFDSSVVKKGEQANISAVASALASSPNDKLLIEGNCDERGTEEYNRSLGERRALAAREALAKAGVSPDRIRTISYGKDKPVNPGHDEAAWSANRRADFILLHPKPGM